MTKRAGVTLDVHDHVDVESKTNVKKVNKTNIDRGTNPVPTFNQIHCQKSWPFSFFLEVQVQSRILQFQIRCLLPQSQSCVRYVQGMNGPLCLSRYLGIFTGLRYNFDVFDVFSTKSPILQNRLFPELSWRIPNFVLHYSPKISAEKISAEKLPRKKFRRTFGIFGGKKFGRKKFRRKKFRRAFSPKFFLAEIFSLVIISIHLKITFSAIWNFQYILW